MRVGVLGGTFDPPHLGHLILAQYSFEQLLLARLLFLPAGDPWRKAGRDVAPAMHRLEMTRLAVAEDGRFEVDDREMRRAGSSYTVDTLAELRTELNVDDESLFIVGEDALADLPFWHDPAGIATLATIAVVPREGVEMPPLPFDGSRIERVKMPYIGVSSTELRERVRSGLSIRYLVPPAVETYIAEHGLYTDGER